MSKLGLKEIRKLELIKITLPRDCGDWLDLWFLDIMERRAPEGDMYKMLREAYVLGARHAQIGMEEIEKKAALVSQSGLS